MGCHIHSSDSHHAVNRQSSGSHQAVILIYLVLSSIELDCTLYYITVTLRYTEALKLHCFLKKNPLQYIDINLMKCGFELHGFFLEPKTAYLKALLYFILQSNPNPDWSLVHTIVCTHHSISLEDASTLYSLSPLPQKICSPLE